MAKQEKQIKIALVGYKLAHGGQERVFSTVSALLNQANCDVHVIVLEDAIEYPYFGTLLNLGSYSKFQKYFVLRKYLKNNQFDFVIDFRHRINPWMELVFLYFVYRQVKTIYTVHTSVLALHFTSTKWIADQIFNKVYRIISVSSEMNKKIKHDYNFNKGFVIPNCVIDENTNNIYFQEHKLPFKYIIAVGRLVAMKQFDKLIQSYCQSELVRSEFHLVILGEGEEKENLQKQIENTKVSKYIHLLGFKKNIFYFIKNAEFLVLTSQYEGFGMVILEALNLEVPVVSFDCETGPSEMIINEFNGLLVDNQNFDELTTAINRMTLDQVLYDFCKRNTKSSITQFSAQNIQKKWLDLLDIKTN